MNQSPSSSATFKNEDASSYDAVVAEFDHFTSLLITPLVARMLALADIASGHSVLVVAVGSGSPWFSLQGITHRIRRLPELLLGLQGKILIAPAFLNALVERHIPANGEEQTALARAHHNRTGDLPELVRKAGFVNI